MKRMLIVYYSWSNGNTERIARQLQEETGADILRIETASSYTGSYDEVVAQGKEEADSGFQPELQPIGANLSDYDMIAVGTPTWWYTMAPAVLTFLKKNNFIGKVVIPFMTNGGWPGHVIKDMRNACAGAQVELPMEVRFDSEGGSKLKTAQADIDAWVKQVNALCGA